jgi:hypothetical protein
VRQLDAELRRFFARRIVRGTFLLAVLLILLVVTIVTIRGHAGNEFSLDPATGKVTDPVTGRVVQTMPPGQSPYAQINGDDSEGHLLFGRSDTRMNVGRHLADAMQGVGVALLFAAFAVGASFVGAEYNVGSLTTQLMFEPRRWRVHLAKAFAVAIGVAVLTFAVVVFLALAMYAGSELKGVVGGLDSAFVVHRTGQALRITGAAAAGGVLAYAVTLVVRRSSAGMAFFFLQFVLIGLINPTQKPFGVISHYAPLRALVALIVHHPQAQDVDERVIHTLAGASVLTALWVAIIVAAAGAWFARSEVR